MRWRRSAAERERRRGDRRQRGFDPAFAIPDRALPDDLASAVDEWAGRPPEPPEPPEPVAPPPPVDGFDDDTVAAMATELWRTGRRIDRGVEDERTQRQLARGTGSMRDRLRDAGVEIEDHDGLAFVEGLALDVVAWEPREGVESDVVVETVQPSVYRAGRCIQMGQVIVAQPGREVTS